MLPRFGTRKESLVLKAIKTKPFGGIRTTKYFPAPLPCCVAKKKCLLQSSSSIQNAIYLGLGMCNNTPDMGLAAAFGDERQIMSQGSSMDVTPFFLDHHSNKQTMLHQDMWYDVNTRWITFTLQNLFGLRILLVVPPPALIKTRDEGMKISHLGRLDSVTLLLLFVSFFKEKWKVCDTCISLLWTNPFSFSPSLLRGVWSMVMDPVPLYLVEREVAYP